VSADDDQHAGLDGINFTASLTQNAVQRLVNDANPKSHAPDQ
jgi:hypothetical protein